MSPEDSQFLNFPNLSPDQLDTLSLELTSNGFIPTYMLVYQNERETIYREPKSGDRVYVYEGPSGTYVSGVTSLGPLLRDL